MMVDIKYIFLFKLQMLDNGHDFGEWYIWFGANQ